MAEKEKDPVPPSKPTARPDEQPVRGPRGPRSPYPVNDPSITDPAPGAEPDYVPGTPSNPGTQM